MIADPPTTADKAPTADELLAELESRPEDQALCERCARALVAAGRPAEAVAVLQAGFIHFNAHEPGSLPCLCRRCIVGDQVTTEAQEMTFRRDFVTASGRVLWYWMPEDLVPEKRRVRRSVEVGLRSRLG